MTSNMIPFDTETMSPSLLLSPYSLAKFSEKPYSPIHDEQAISIIKSLNYDCEKLENNENNLLLNFARAFHFDEAIKNYLSTHPQALIVNLGCGLETSFYRNDNRKLLWLNLDLPEVIELHQKLFPHNERVHYMTKSILDFSWMDDIKNLSKEVFFICGEVLTHFSEAEVKSLFLEIAKNFPLAKMILNTIPKKDTNNANSPHAQWGNDDPREIEGWSAHIRVVSHFSYFSKLKSEHQFPLSLRIKMYLLDLNHRGSIVNLRID